MVILGVESSARSASAAVLKDGVIISSFYLNNGLTHSVTLGELTMQALKYAGASPEELDAAAVSVGPGSFTGVRIGVALVKGLGFASDLPCIGISTLDAIAYPFRHDTGCVLSLMDARRNQFYSASFRYEQGKAVRLTEDAARDIEEIQDMVRQYSGSRILLAGDGACLAFDLLRHDFGDIELADPALRYQNAASVALLGAERFAAGEHCSADELAPVYLRPSQAERERSARMKKTES